MSGPIAADVAVNNAVTQFVGLESADANGVINTGVPTAIRPAKPTRTARAGFSKNDCKPGRPSVLERCHDAAAYDRIARTRRGARHTRAVRPRTVQQGS